MSIHAQQENPPGITNPQGNFYHDDVSQKNIPENETVPNPPDWMADIEQTLQLGEQFVGAIGGIADLARVEALLAFRTLSKLLMLWLLIMPIMLLTWCAFSVLMAWSVVAISGVMGWGLLAFFLQQVVLLLACRWLYVKYRTRMTLPNTRAQIDNFVRSTRNGFKGKSQIKE
jgi:uncharacterized membrane protein YqjE